MGDAPISARFFMLGAMLFFVSGFKSCSELLYMTGGAEATGRVTRIAEESSRRAGHTGWRIEYQFKSTETGERERGQQFVTDSEVMLYQQGQEILVEHRGADPVFSRIKGYNNTIWVWVFLGSTAFCIATVAFMTLHDTDSKKKRSRR